MKRITKTEAQEKAQERTDSLDMLINVTDIDESADEWSDLSEIQIDDEIAECFMHMNVRNDSRYSDLVFDLSMQFMSEALPRVPMEDLVFESHSEALKNGYWPNKMSRAEMEDMAYNKIQCHTFKNENEDLAHYWKESESEAVAIVEEGIANGLKPDSFK